MYYRSFILSKPLSEIDLRRQVRHAEFTYVTLKMTQKGTETTSMSSRYIQHARSTTLYDHYGVYIFLLVIIFGGNHSRSRFLASPQMGTGYSIN